MDLEQLCAKAIEEVVAHLQGNHVIPTEQLDRLIETAANMVERAFQTVLEMKKQRVQMFGSVADVEEPPLTARLSEENKTELRRMLAELNADNRRRHEAMLERALATHHGLMVTVFTATGMSEQTANTLVNEILSVVP